MAVEKQLFPFGPSVPLCFPLYEHMRSMCLCGELNLGVNLFKIRSGKVSRGLRAVTAQIKLLLEGCPSRCILSGHRTN